MFRLQTWRGVLSWVTVGCSRRTKLHIKFLHSIPRVAKKSPPPSKKNPLVYPICELPLWDSVSSGDGKQPCQWSTVASNRVNIITRFVCTMWMPPLQRHGRGQLTRLQCWSSSDRQGEGGGRGRLGPRKATGSPLTGIFVNARRKKSVGKNPAALQDT